MVRLLTLLSALLLVIAPAVSAELVQSGFIEMDLNDYTPAENGTALDALANVLVNPGFETGALPPWTTDNWSVTGADFHTGAFSAEDIGNFWIRQDFAPIPVGDINLIAFWCRQPDGPAFQAVDFFYSAVDFDEFLTAPGHDWTFIDVTSQLRAVGSLVAIRIWGYSGGPPSPDLTRADDVILDADIVTATETSSWGRVKGLYR